MWIAAVLSRLLWPVLPQRLLRDNLLALFAQIKALLNGDSVAQDPAHPIPVFYRVLAVAAEEHEKRIWRKFSSKWRFYL
jgi:hypothetical protein